MGIGIGTNYLQEWYRDLNFDVSLHTNIISKQYYSSGEDDRLNVEHIITDTRPYAEEKIQIIYFIISYAQFILIPAWVILCIFTTGIIFYNRELKKPIEILMNASEKISENQLDFHIDYKSRNEFGLLCSAFENMRKALDENNREMWKSFEERKRLNSAFSHDLRTPLTVLKGYNEFLEKYIPQGQVSEKKLMNVLSMMHGQIERLENYTYKMSAVQKLEDIIPDLSEISAESLKKNLTSDGEIICSGKNFRFDFSSDSEIIITDIGLVSEVYENLLSNSARYAENEITADINILNKMLTISVSDDGKGFSEKALRLASEPFYRGDTEQNSFHFGLGLYICRIICEKFQGSLKISNTEKGGNVTAEFFLENR